MVRGNRHPTWSDPVEKWSDSRVAAADNRRDIPDVLRGYISGLR